MGAVSGGGCDCLVQDYCSENRKSRCHLCPSARAGASLPPCLHFVMSIPHSIDTLWFRYIRTKAIMDERLPCQDQCRDRAVYLIDQITHRRNVRLPSYPPSEWGGDDVSLSLMPSARLALREIFRERSHGARCTVYRSGFSVSPSPSRLSKATNGSPPNSVTGLP